MLRRMQHLLSSPGVTHSSPRNPLIAIVGATGTGKSQLAVDLATRFNGEIINGDAMQMYHGLPIITNKIPFLEQKGVPHHLLGCIGLEEPPWRVDTFVRRALGIIEDIHRRGRLPILVGGTHYYTHSLLFHDALAEQKLAEPKNVGSESDSATVWPILEAPTEDILAKLREVDPIMADRWHPQDRRKLRRSLEIWFKTGNRASDVYLEQQERRQVSEDVKHDENGVSKGAGVVESGSNHLQHGMRFPTLLFWVHTPRDILYDRLRDRVDKMIRAGLLQEVLDSNLVLRQLTEQGHPVDESRGIWVSVGYKEFHLLLEALHGRYADPAKLEELQKQGVELTKIATWQYTKQQTKWIRIKLVNALREFGADGSMFVLDTSDPKDWENSTLHSAVEYTRKFLAGMPLPDPRGESPVAAEMLSPKRDYDLSRRQDLWKQQTCETCMMTAVTERDWEQHVKSNRHRKRVKKTSKNINTRCRDESLGLQDPCEPADSIASPLRPPM